RGAERRRQRWNLGDQQTCTNPADLAELAAQRSPALRLRQRIRTMERYARRARSVVAPVRRAGCSAGMGRTMNRLSGLNFLRPYPAPYRGRALLALLSLIVAAGTVLAFGACLRALIDRGFAQGRPDILNYALASLLVVALVLALASGARFYLVSWLGERVV